MVIKFKEIAVIILEKRSIDNIGINGSYERLPFQSVTFPQTTLHVALFLP